MQNNYNFLTGIFQNGPDGAQLRVENATVTKNDSGIYINVREQHGTLRMRANDEAADGDEEDVDDDGVCVDVDALGEVSSMSESDSEESYSSESTGSSGEDATASSQED